MLTFVCLDGDVLILKFLPLPLLVFLVGLSFSLLLAIFSHRKQEPEVYWVSSSSPYICEGNGLNFFLAPDVRVCSLCSFRRLDQLYRQ